MKFDLDGCKICQGFGENPATYAPLKGHPAIDAQGGYGSLIHSPVDMFIYKVLTVARPSNDGSGFTGVFGIIDDGIECYELLIGHCDPSASEGQYVKKGDAIGTEANHGRVYEGGIPITLAMQVAGDKRGSHRHIQKRAIFKSASISQPALSEHSDLAGTYRDVDGFYYPIFDYENGYHGCIDPTGSVFKRDLTLGAEGYDVYVLQRILLKLGFAKGFGSPTGFFGSLTRAALGRYQAAAQIEPQLGYFGPKSREFIQKTFSV